MVKDDVAENMFEAAIAFTYCSLRVHQSCGDLDNLLNCSTWNASTTHSNCSHCYSSILHCSILNL